MGERDVTERNLEEAIENHLVSIGYKEGNSKS